MTHFGTICPTATGHLNTMTALGRNLLKRGHRVTVLGMPDAEPNAKAAGLDAQLVISLGGGLEPEALPYLPGNPLVVKYAPQLELLQKASLLAMLE